MQAVDNRGYEMFSVQFQLRLKYINMGQAIVSVNIDMESIHELCELFPQQIEKGRHITVHCSVSGTFGHQERNRVITGIKIL